MADFFDSSPTLGVCLEQADHPKQRMVYMERINGNGAHAPIESTVVVIDDNATLRQATTAALEGAWFHVQAFPTGRSFLDSFNGRASCILLELRLRDVSGLEVLKALNEKMNVVPVIVTS